MGGIWIVDVATARNKSTQFVFLRKKDRQSGKDITKRRMISTSKIIVATVSITAKMLVLISLDREVYLECVENLHSLRPFLALE